MKIDSGLVDNGLAVDQQRMHGGREHGRAQVRTESNVKDDVLCELASFRMRFIIVMTLKLFNRQLLGKLAKLCIELRKTNAQPKTNDEQNEDEEKEYEVRGRHCTDEIRKPKEHLGDNTRK